ncbi:cation:proton antiporter [Leptospira mayottensis]|uniref:Transporter, CPA2 family n=2 Tax=Leptospira mayottensis TaxID=1137606 RepID=A0AA87SW83_9LEPT|nr:cation:proton antiporter [Leptospira mayottensis]AXR61012.1 cation/H(+) antiporter [Leptospira mayottensis]AXR65732.1 cation/H(+) antiporter [Leptospira mayottensis]AXR68566.1 cation/H(+) antiporter [Leptospira mayottensis]AZQ02554.1 cation/H(+) antiporter [Leptospira mayottensis 200901116]EKR98863.1 transporter, CPA2 family [Leptospira mayottensis 200901122]
MKKISLFYIFLIFLFILSLGFILQTGQNLEPEKKNFHSSQISSEKNTKARNYPVKTVPLRPDFLDVEAMGKIFSGHLRQPISRLLLQLIIIMFSARFFGKLATILGQPSVIGEILAGILLGPSLLGLVFPEGFQLLFPKESLSTLQILSQLGLLLFMFVIGMELDLKILKNQAESAVIISHSSIMFPFLLGVGLAYFIYVPLAPEGVDFVAFCLFMGTGMSITAFPVLARIILEKGLTKTALGSLALTAAAADDVTAWCVLAIVVTIVNAGSFSSGILMIVMSLTYMFVMWKGILPLMRRAGNLYTTKESMTKTITAFFFLFIFFSAWITEAIGIHALFGAFLAGVVMPDKKELRDNLVEKIEDFSLTVLLPLFFAFTGLRTKFGLLSSSGLWPVFFLILFVAVLGKLGGSSIASRMSGKNWKDSLSIGILMNTRGLMELIVLNIGYDLGVLSEEIFSMMVLMALATTIMTGPGLKLVEFFFTKKSSTVKPATGTRILISFAQHSRGLELLKIAYGLFPEKKKEREVTAVHLSPDSNISEFHAEKYESSSFTPLKELSKDLNIQLQTIYKTSTNITKDIIRIVNEGNYKLLLIGAARSFFSDDILGGKIRTILNETDCNAGILFSSQLEDVKNIHILFGKEKDLGLLHISKRLADNYNSKLSIVDLNGSVDRIPSRIKQNFKKEKVKILTPGNDSSDWNKFDLILCDLDIWENHPEFRVNELPKGGGLLLVRSTDDFLTEI